MHLYLDLFVSCNKIITFHSYSLEKEHLKGKYFLFILISDSLD